MNDNIFEILCRHWVHSREEDTATEMVFRPSTLKLPPSRGRFSFELKADGGITEHRIGATDRSAISEGTWSLEDNENLNIYSAQTDSNRIFNIVSVTPEKLVVKK
jgi:hypothetical protein